MIRIALGENIWDLFHKSLSPMEILSGSFSTYYKFESLPNNVLCSFRTKALRVINNQEVMLQIDYKVDSSEDEIMHIFEIREILA